MMSPTKKVMIKKYPSIAGLQEKESQVSDPWGSLFKLIQHIATLLNWDIDTDFFTKPRDYQWQQILVMYQRVSQTNQESNSHQMLYMTTVIFLDCLYSYISCIDTDIFAISSSTSGLQSPLVLIEGFKTDRSNTDVKSKKLRPDMQPSCPHITANSQIQDSQSIINNFTTALKCYELLHSDDLLQRDFIKLCQNWRSETWSWMGHFQTDMFIYQGLFQEAVGHLQNFRVGMTEKMQLRNTLQLASCFYCLSNYPRACELILDMIGSLTEFSNMDSKTTPAVTDKESKNKKPSSGRQLLLTVCSESEILSYCIQLLLSCFKEKAFQANAEDVVLGHMIVLLQYDWPKHYSTFSKAIHAIQSRRMFTYNIFFNYVINIDILEEFAFIKTQEGGKVSLDILPISTKVMAQQRTVTRGVNKGVKEDFRATMEKQISRSNEPIEKVIYQFLTEEKSLILANLLQV